MNSGGDAAAWAAGAGVRAGAASLRGSNLQECMRTGCCEGSDLAFCFWLFQFLPDADLFFGGFCFSRAREWG